MVSKHEKVHNPISDQERGRTAQQDFVREFSCSTLSMEMVTTILETLRYYLMRLEILIVYDPGFLLLDLFHVVCTCAPGV